MKKFFLTIFFLIISFSGVYAQSPLNMSDFTALATNGQCSSDGKISVSLRNGMAPLGRKVQVKLDIPGDPVGRTEPLEVGVAGKNSIEFNTLRAGSYTVTVIDVATNRNASKVVTLTSQYVSPEPVSGSLKATSPSCTGIDYDGKVSFRIPIKAKGPFVVKLFKEGSTTPIYNQTHPNPNPNREL